MAQTPEVVEGDHLQVWPGENIGQFLADGCDGDQRSRAGRFRLPRPAFRTPERHGVTAYLQTVQLEGQQAGNASWTWVVDERDGAVSKRPFRNDEGVTLFDVLSDTQRDGISD